MPSLSHEVGNNGDTGEGDRGGWVAFPTFPEKFRLPSASANRVALSFNFVRFTRFARLPFSVRLSHSPRRYIPKTMQRDRFQADKTVLASRDENEKNPERDELVCTYKPTRVYGLGILFFFLFSLANKKHLISPPPVIIPSSHAILSSVHPSSHLPRSLSLLFHT